MYIWAYFLEKEAKNLLKIKLNKIVSNITDDFIEILFTVNPDKKYQNMMINLEENIKESVLEILKETFKSHISHNVAKCFSYEPKSYSKRKIQKLIKLQEYKANGINILGLYLKSYKNNEQVILKKRRIKFWHI